MRAAIYTRVSSEMQVEGYSLDVQLEVCRSLIENRGWTYVAHYSDEGVSAKTTDRPQFQRMLAAAGAGEFDVIVVHKVDRFSRSVIDLLLTLREMEKRHVTMVAATEDFDYTTPIGRMFLVMAAAVAEWYLANLSAETTKGKKARAEAGLWNSALPFGYTTTYMKDGGTGLALIDEHQAAGVQMAFQAYASGEHSYSSVARLLNEAGYRPRGRGKRALPLWSKDTVTDLLQNRFYTGDVQYKGEWRPGVHEPIVSDDLFRRVQEVRRRRQKARGISARRASHIYPLAGLARCARCGNPMRGQSTQSYRYYRDPAADRMIACDQGMLRADEAEERVGEALGELVLPADWREQILARAKSRSTPQPDVARERQKLERQLDALKLQHRLGDIADDDYLSERERLVEALADLAPPAVTPDFESAAELLASVGELWQVGTPAERRRLARSLLQVVYLDRTTSGNISVQLVPKHAFRDLFALAQNKKSLE